MGAYKSDKHALSFKNHYNQIAYQFDYAVDAFLLNGIEVEIATGNAERINAWLRKKIYFGEIHHWPLIHFSMLLGIRPDIAHSLKKAGCAPHLYLLFGDAWFPYFWRRILENPQNLLLPFQKQHPY
jgi:proline dehydrogenase